MTRWLQAAQRASGAGTKPTKLTEPSPEGVLSEKSVLSEGVRADPVPDDPDDLALDLYEERAAWPEARRAAGITALDEWRAQADDVTNPDAWQ